MSSKHEPSPSFADKRHMDNWDHPICDPCWSVLMPRQCPKRLPITSLTCCFCHERRSSGIFLRINPEAIRKVTYHEDHFYDEE